MSVPSPMIQALVGSQVVFSADECFNGPYKTLL